jgi:hypothetical protein
MSNNNNSNKVNFRGKQSKISQEAFDDLVKSMESYYISDQESSNMDRVGYDDREYALGNSLNNPETLKAAYSLYNIDPEAAYVNKFKLPKEVVEQDTGWWGRHIFNLVPFRTDKVGKNLATAFNYGHQDETSNPFFSSKGEQFLTSLFNTSSGMFKSIWKGVPKDQRKDFLEFLYNEYQNNPDFAKDFDELKFNKNDAGIASLYNKFQDTSKGLEALESLTTSEPEIPKKKAEIPAGLPRHLNVTKGDPVLLDQYNREDNFKNLLDSMSEADPTLRMNKVLHGKV